MLLCDEEGKTGLLKLPGFIKAKTLNGVRYKLCEGKGRLNSYLRKEYCNCHERYLLSSPFAKYNAEHVKRALMLSRSLGAKSAVKLFSPLRPAPLIILLPRSYLLGVFVKEL